MITRAMITKNIPNEDGTWNVFIPIFSNLPRDAKTRDLLTKNSGAKVANVQNNNYNPQVDSTVDFDIDKTEVLNTLSSVTTDKLQDYSYKATVCGIMGIDYNFSMGDTVLVTFENDDKTRPIIIGSLITNEIIKKRELNPEAKYANLTLGSLVVNDSTDLLKSNNLEFTLNGESFSLNNDTLTTIWNKGLSEQGTGADYRKTVTQDLNYNESLEIDLENDSLQFICVKITSLTSTKECKLLYSFYGVGHRISNLFKNSYPTTPSPVDVVLASPNNYVRVTNTVNGEVVSCFVDIVNLTPLNN